MPTNLERRLRVIATMCAVATLPLLPAISARAATEPTDAIAIVDEQIVDEPIIDESNGGDESESNDFLDLERSLTECISSNPPPGCGRVPTSPGDRGGWQQLLLFGVMMSGIAVIFWRVSKAVRNRDASAAADTDASTR